MGNRSPRILLLGASGVVGSEVRRQLTARGLDGALTTVSRRGRAGTIAADLNDPAAIAPLAARADIVINAVACTRWTMEPTEALAANVHPLRVVLDVIPARAQLIHLSTSYADGLRPGDEPDGFRNNYEWSKAVAEQLLRAERPTAQLLRFPLVIGRVEDGCIERFVGIYTILQALTAGLLPAVIGAETTRVELVPVDVVADAVCRMVSGELATPVGTRSQGFSLGSGHHAPTVDGLLDSMVGVLNQWREARGLSALARPPVINTESWERFHRPFLWPHIGRVQRRAIELLEAFGPYLSHPLIDQPDEACAGVVRALEQSVWRWAEASPRTAAREPRPWAMSETGIWA